LFFFAVSNDFADGMGRETKQATDDPTLGDLHALHADPGLSGTLRSD
jgi:hypothetical protein